MKQARAWPKLEIVPAFGDALVCRMRDRAASHFFTETDAEVMLMVDHDIIWEEGDLEYIAKKCAKNKGIVAGIYPKRSMGQDIPVRFAPLSAGESRKVFFGDDVCLDADFVTTGFMAIHRDVLTALVKEMPLTIGGFWPFFTPALTQHAGGVEYLSEDWAFCLRAKGKGFKIWAAMKPRLKHIGEWIYRMVDANYEPPPDTKMSITISDRDINKDSPLVKTLVEDIYKLEGLPPERFASETMTARQKMVELWEENKPKTPAGERAWYLREDVGRASVLELADGHMRGVTTGIIREIEETVSVSEGPVLEYGAGIGTLALHLSSKGFDVDAYEPNEFLAGFIQRRAELHGLTVNKKNFVAALRDDYQIIILWHVLEHMPDFEQVEVMKDLEKRLAPGGRIISQSDFHVDQIHPFHHVREDNGDGLLFDVGLVRTGPNIWVRASEVPTGLTRESRPVDA